MKFKRKNVNKSSDKLVIDDDDDLKLVESELSTAASTVDAQELSKQLTGILSKRADRGPLKRWSERHFALEITNETIPNVCFELLYFFVKYS